MIALWLATAAAQTAAVFDTDEVVLVDGVLDEPGWARARPRLAGRPFPGPDRGCSLRSGGPQGYARHMGRKPLTANDGPLAGQVYELDLVMDEEVRLRLPDGGFAIYRVVPDPENMDSVGHRVPSLAFVALVPAE